MSLRSLILAGFSLVVRCSAASATSPLLSNDVLSNIAGIVQSESVPGMAVGVVRADGGTEFANFGIKSETGENMTTDTLIPIASASKPFLALTMGILIDDYAQGRNTTPLPNGLKSFTFDTKIQDLLPGQWQLEDQYTTQKAAVKDLLSHSVGFPRHDFAYTPNDTFAGLVPRLKDLHLAYELREQYGYNNIMYIVCQEIITKYTGDFITFMIDRVFTPLNMTATTYDPDVASATGRLTQNFDQFGRRIPSWFTEQDFRLVAGAGGIISTTEDMVKFLALFLNGGVNPTTNETILSTSSYLTLTTSRIVSVGALRPGKAEPASIQGDGAGWYRQSIFGHDVILHDGSFYGVSSLFMFAPNDGIGLIMLANAHDKNTADLDVAYEILGSAFGVAPATISSSISKRSSEPSSTLVRREQADSLPLDFTGTYSNAGYGQSFTICSLNSTSPECAQVLSNFSTIAATSNSSLNVTDLYAAWPRTWCTHVRMEYQGGNSFTFDPVYLFLAGFGNNTTPFQLFEKAQNMKAEFQVEDGRVVGLGTFENKAVLSNRQLAGGSVQETADVFFTKL